MHVHNFYFAYIYFLNIVVKLQKKKHKINVGLNQKKIKIVFRNNFHKNI